MAKLCIATTLLSLCGVAGFGLSPRVPAAAQRLQTPVATMLEPAPQGRRGALELAGLASLALLAAAPQSAQASGGATAGKYTTIPIAKRRYFGRVKQGVQEFKEVGASIKSGDLKSAAVTEFFASNIKTTSERQKKQCMMSEGCTVQEKFSSRYEDMKLSMYLLGNAFRMDSGKPPEKVKQVKEAKVFFQQVDKLQLASSKGNVKEAKARYADAIDALEIFLNDVELPPTTNAEYNTVSLEVPSLCQGSFCI